VNEESVNEPTIHPSDDLNAALADFGDSPAARRRAQASRKRWRESVKSIAPRAHVVITRPSVPTDHNPRDVERPATFTRPVDEWAPTYRATRRLSDRVPFAHALSGYDPDRVDDEDYPWSVP
jgi:hypothetical protein